MKILYGEGDFLESRHQLIAYPASVGAERKLTLEKNVSLRHPDVRQCVLNMFAENDNYNVVPPQLGDVIWTQTSGSKWIAHCIVFDERGNLREDALTLCMKSLKRKALELGQDQIGIPLRWYDDIGSQKSRWVRIYETIEDAMSDEEDENVLGKYQVFAYDPDSEYVRDVFESLPGQKRAFYSDVQIRFRNL
jgi:hypothetical protein